MTGSTKVIVITGGASGIGRATAVLFAERGWRVVIFDVDARAGNCVADQINACGGQAMMVATDVTNELSVTGAVAQAIAHFGRIDALFNNAGILGPAGSVEESSIQHWNEVWGVNVLGTFLVSKHALPHLKVQGGSIVNNSSIVALSGAPLFPAYSAAKAAIVGLTKSMARALGPLKIRVNCVCPGSIEGTNLLARAVGRALTPDERLRLLKQIPLHRIGHPHDVAAAVYFLASDEAAHISGVVLRIDGGEL